MKKIILILDNAIIGLEIKKSLETHGYLVPFIKSTLTDILNESYQMDLVILDLDFIPINQIEELKKPVIFLSSEDESKISNQLSGLEITYDFLYKPFTGKELLIKTHEILKFN